MDKFIEVNSNKLLEYDIAELKDKKDVNNIYYLGKYTFEKVNHYNDNIKYKVKPSHYFTNYNSNNYAAIQNDHIDFKYEIYSELGRGVFGKVLQCFDHKDKEHCAIKIIKRLREYESASKKEVSILKHLNGIKKHENVVDFKEDFKYRGHLFLSFKLYYKNLYEILKMNRFVGLRVDLCLKYSLDIANGIDFIHSNNIVHADLKPENIVFESPRLDRLVIIDFGLSFFEKEEVSKMNNFIYNIVSSKPNFYIQSRYYRAPEVTLQLSKSFNIDIWSVGCIIYEMLRGYPLFPAKSRFGLNELYIKTLNFPDSDFLKKHNIEKKFYHENQYIYDHKKEKYNTNNKNHLDTLLMENIQYFDVKDENNEKNKTKFIQVNQYNNIINIIKSCICWDFEKRINSEKLIKIIDLSVKNDDIGYKYNYTYQNITATLTF